MPASAPIAELAERFPQLYVAPADDAEAAYKLAVTRGERPEGATLDHFVGSPDDSLSVHDTTAGLVEVLYLAERADFETFCRCIMHRASLAQIPPTMGASTIQGLADWGKIAAEYARVLAAGESWPVAFRAFVSDPQNYKVTLVVVSKGPYSAVSAKDAGHSADEWLRVSRDIRTFHELCHVMCRRLLPGDITPVYDEVTADFNGLLRATGTYDDELAACFLGITHHNYAGGRLENYLDKKQLSRIDEISREVRELLATLAERADGADPKDSFALTLALKRERLLAY